MDSLTEEFQDTVTTLGIPGVQTASIHPTNYLPLLNGRPFATFSAAAASSLPPRSPTGPRCSPLRCAAATLTTRHC